MGKQNYTVDALLWGTFFLCGFCHFWANLAWKISSFAFLDEGPAALEILETLKILYKFNQKNFFQKIFYFSL
jgi:hypothetical protein